MFCPAARKWVLLFRTLYFPSLVQFFIPLKFFSSLGQSPRRRKKNRGSEKLPSGRENGFRKTPIYLPSNEIYIPVVVCARRHKCADRPGPKG